MPPIPVRASDRELRRPRPLPKRVQKACLLMIYGNPDDGDDAKPLDFVAAAKLAGVQPPLMRKWLDRPAAIQFIRRERAVFRRFLCSANELALANIRDRGQNDAARVRSVLALEQIDAVSVIQNRGQAQTPGVVIQIIQPPAPAIEPKPVATIEHAPQAAEPERFDADGYRVDEYGQPVFDPARSHR
jgi:hypothetical protein